MTMEINDEELHDHIGVQQISISSATKFSRSTSPNQEEEIVVGFDGEARKITGRLTNEKKQLDNISIVGMAGLGKTTLARKVYNDGLVAYHFDIRAWTCVSNVYRRRDVLLSILSSVVQNRKETSDEKLKEELYRGLKGKRYLIVMDDVWSTEVWEDLKPCFPNDNNGSRIIFTTRHLEVSLQAKCDSPHSLCFLNPHESWKLLRLKVFRKENFPQELEEIGKEIAGKCGGLPLAIVVVAGLLVDRANVKGWWEEVAKSVSSYAVGDTEHCMDVLALSYKYLPHHLKPCFLYFGAFPPDYEIPVWRMIWLWVAEGYIQQIDQRSVEDVAEDYLMDLIDRNLVLVSKRRSSGGIKTCRVHDLLHDLCLRKAREINFPEHTYWYEQVSSLPPPYSSPFIKRLLCFHSHGFHYCTSSNPCSPHIPSFVSFSFEWNPNLSESNPFIYTKLSVLDLWYIHLHDFPNTILRLVDLKYLAIRASNVFNLPSSISNLRNLETFIIDPTSDVTLPPSVWEMLMLRHLHSTSKIKFEGNSYSPTLTNLQTISVLRLSSSTKHVLAKTPNLRKLGLSMWGQLLFPVLDSLNYLESLKVYNNIPKSSSIPQWGNFPPNLKKLSLSYTGLEWKDISILGMLPNLEVLKLLDEAVEGPRWDTSEDEFCNLKYLKLQGLNIVEWNASDDHFPKLERLVLHKCKRLSQIPSGLGYIYTLQMIELYWPTRFAANSAREIQEEQLSIGNGELKFIIYPPNEVDQRAQEMIEED